MSRFRSSVRRLTKHVDMPVFALMRRLEPHIAVSAEGRAWALRRLREKASDVPHQQQPRSPGVEGKESGHLGVPPGCGWVCDLPDIGPWTMRPYGDLVLVHSDCSGLWAIRAGKLKRP